MPHAEEALGRLTAAGNDTEALAEAIEYASFLDATPGDDRQKLRGAVTCLTIPSNIRFSVPWNRKINHHDLSHAVCIAENLISLQPPGQS